jgi:tetratricopeptide (TPR) repeat protein
VRELDAWATAWLDVRRTQCNAAIERSSTTVAPHASMCLEAAHARFAALVERLAAGDERTVIDAFNLVDRLPNVIACSGDQGGELGPAVREEAVAIEHELARAMTLGAAAGLAIADSALVRADATAVPLLGARARLTRAQLLEEVDRTDDAIASYHDAIVEAESSGDDRLAVEALVMLAFARGVLRHDFDDAHTALDLAAAKVERGALDWLAQARVTRIRGQVLHAARRWPEALVELERAYALYVEHLGSDHPNAARLESSLAATKFHMGDIAGAEAHTRHAVEVMSRRLGENHPLLLFTRSDLAVFAKMRGDTDEAVAQLEVLVPKIDVAVGDGDHRKSVAFLQLGGAQLAAGRAAAAVATLRRAVELRERMLPESDLDMRALRAVLLEALVTAGELDEARRELADLRRIHAEHGSSDPEHPKVLAEIADMLATATR